MKKVVGYTIAIVGLVLMVIGFGMVELDLGIPKALLSSVPIIGGAAIAIGIFMVIKNSSPKSNPEVPIYEGEKIVGYRRH